MACRSGCPTQDHASCRNCRERERRDSKRTPEELVRLEERRARTSTPEWRAMSRRQRLTAGMAAARQRDPRRAWDTKLRHKYGVTADEYEAMVLAQGDRCAICGTTDPGGPGRWQIDHDHACCDAKRSCGRCVRSLLCVRCNAALGLLGDNRDVLASALEYLERWNVLPNRLS